MSNSNHIKLNHLDLQKAGFSNGRSGFVSFSSTVITRQPNSLDMMTSIFSLAIQGPCAIT